MNLRHRLAYPERTRWKISACLKSVCWCKLVGRYKRHYVRMTSNISFWNSPASFSQFEKELYGVNSAYRCLHFPKICTNGLIFGEGGFFHLGLSEYANQINNFTNLIFCYVTLLDLLRERTVRILCCKKVEILQITLQCDSRFSAHEKIKPIKADKCLHILRTLRKEGYTQSEIELIFNSIVLP